MKAQFINIFEHFGGQRITAQVTSEYICLTPKDDNRTAEKSISISIRDFEALAEILKKYK